MSKNVVMINPKTKVTITTTKQFQPKWEKLGFRPYTGVIQFSMAV